jgi:hypothetical protein
MKIVFEIKEKSQKNYESISKNISSIKESSDKIEIELKKGTNLTSQEETDLINLIKEKKKEKSVTKQ